MKLRDICVYLCRKGWLNWVSDETYLKCIYRLKIGEKLNLENPQTFNEKMQWLKLNDRNEEYIKLVDKYEVKKFIQNKFGEEFVIPTIGIWETFDEIDFETLPNEFVLKCTHDSGGLIICKNKKELNLKKARKKISKCLKKNYYYCWREWPYKQVKPRIIAEKYMIDDSKKELKDYKFFCFDGIPEVILVCSNRFNDLKETFFDSNWKRLKLKRLKHDIDDGLEKPCNFDKMMEFSKEISQNMKFVRVDFYESNNRLYFGEITFYPASGLEHFEPKEYDKILGDKIKIK